MKTVSGPTALLIATAVMLMTALVLTALANRFGWDTVIGTDTSLLQATLAIGTFAGAAGSLFFLQRRWVHDTEERSSAARRERIDVIQGAATLMGSGSATSQVAGIAMISGLAEVSPKEVGAVAMTMLANYVTERSASEWDKQSALVNAGMPAAPFARSTTAIVLAISQLSYLRKTVGIWPGAEGQLGIFHMDRWVIANARFLEVTLNGGHFVNMMINDLTFERSDFSNSFLHTRANGRLRFVDCDLRGMNLVIRDFEGRGHGHPEFSAQLEIIDCRTDGMQVLDQAVDG